MAPAAATSACAAIRTTTFRSSLTAFSLNDTGNYAIYIGEYMDAAIVDHVTVNTGTTDVDSPTASATGGTINS